MTAVNDYFINSDTQKIKWFPTRTFKNGNKPETREEKSHKSTKYKNRL